MTEKTPPRSTWQRIVYFADKAFDVVGGTLIIIGLSPLLVFVVPLGMLIAWADGKDCHASLTRDIWFEIRLTWYMFRQRRAKNRRQSAA